MKKVLSVSLLMLCLSFPAFAGHTTEGGRYCDCTLVNSTCPCCGAGVLSSADNQESVSTTKSIDSNSTDSMPEFELLLLGILVWLRLKA